MCRDPDERRNSREEGGIIFIRTLFDGERGGLESRLEGVDHRKNGGGKTLAEQKERLTEGGLRVEEAGAPDPRKRDARAVRQRRSPQEKRDRRKRQRTTKEGKTVSDPKKKRSATASIGGPSMRAWERYGGEREGVAPKQQLVKEQRTNRHSAELREQHDK